MSWLVKASAWALAEFREASPASSSQANTCFAEARRILAVCVGFGEELLDGRRAPWAAIFVAGFLCRAITPPIPSGLVAVRAGVLRGVGRLARGSRGDLSQVAAALTDGGVWHTLEADLVTAPEGTGEDRRSRFAIAR